jgi:adenosine deaminase
MPQNTFSLTSFSATEQQLTEKWKLIPKVDLHRHLDCSMRWSTLIELAQLSGISMPATEIEQKKFFLVQEPMIDLESVLKKFLMSQQVLATEAILERLAFEAVEDAFNDGVKILELRYSPTFIEQGHPQLNFEKIHLALLKGMNKACAQYNIIAGLILIIQRTLPVASAESVVDFAIEHKDSLIGIDLADNETNFSAKSFQNCFLRSTRAGIPVTIHAGETPTKEAIQNVKDSVELLGAKRIGHGLQIYQSQEMMSWIQKHQIPLEICPISNWLTQAIPKIEDHPLKKLYSEGILTTLNSDDPGIFGTTLSMDCAVTEHRLQFSQSRIESFFDLSAQVSFIAPQLKQKVWPSLKLNS